MKQNQVPAEMRGHRGGLSPGPCKKGASRDAGTQGGIEPGTLQKSSSKGLRAKGSKTEPGRGNEEEK